MNLTADGDFEIWLNEAGRSRLIEELARLNERNDHFHFSPERDGEDYGEITVRSVPYRPDDTLFEHGKVYLRQEAWDREHFPHVMSEGD